MRLQMGSNILCWIRSSYAGVHRLISKWQWKGITLRWGLRLITATWALGRSWRSRSCCSSRDSLMSMSPRSTEIRSQPSTRKSRQQQRSRPATSTRCHQESLKSTRTSSMFQWCLFYRTGPTSPSIVENMHSLTMFNWSSKLPQQSSTPTKPRWTKVVIPSTLTKMILRKKHDKHNLQKKDEPKTRNIAYLNSRRKRETKSIIWLMMLVNGRTSRSNWNWARSEWRTNRNALCKTSSWRLWKMKERAYQR